MTALTAADLLGVVVEDDWDLVAAVRRGLPVRVIEVLARHLSLSPADISHFIVPDRTLRLRKQQRKPLSADHSARAARLARVFAAAVTAFGEADKALTWMRRPNRALRRQAPLALLDTEQGAQLVEAVIDRIAHGVFE